MTICKKSDPKVTMTKEGPLRSITDFMTCIPSLKKSISYFKNSVWLGFLVVVEIRELAKPWNYGNNFQENSNTFGK